RQFNAAQWFMRYLPWAVKLPPPSSGIGSHPSLRSAMTLRFAFLLVVIACARVSAQQRFTTQILVVPAFQGSDRGMANKAADIIRGRVAGAFPRSELRVVC